MRYTLPVISFNITVTCNLNCNGCFVGSNFNYQGHSSWQEQRYIYERWAEKVDIKAWEMYGGEPLLNPDWYEWFEGISQLWPEARGWVLSNGYAVSAEKNKRLYELLKNSNGRYWLEISHHNADKEEWMIGQVHKFLEGEVKRTFMSERDFWEVRGLDFDDLMGNQRCLDTLITSYNDIKDDSWPDIRSLEDWHSLPEHILHECKEVHGVTLEKIREFVGSTDNTVLGVFTDANGVSVIVRRSTSFSDGVVSILDNDSGLAFHESDAGAAHRACLNKRCFEFHNGAMHQCNSVGHFEGWSRQLPIELTDGQRALIEGYKPLTADSTVEEIAQWFEYDRKQPIPQCSLCPEKRTPFEIAATTKKIKFKR